MLAAALRRSGQGSARARVGLRQNSATAPAGLGQGSGRARPWLRQDPARARPWRSPGPRAARAGPARAREGSGACPTGPPGAESSRSPEGLRAPSVMAGALESLESCLERHIPPEELAEVKRILYGGEARCASRTGSPPAPCGSLSLCPGPAAMPIPGVRGRNQCEGGCAGHRKKGE